MAAPASSLDIEALLLTVQARIVRVDFRDVPAARPGRAEADFERCRPVPESLDAVVRRAALVPDPEPEIGVAGGGSQNGWEEPLKVISATA